MKSISGAVLAGGKSFRMGTDKAMLQLNERTFLQNSLLLLASFTKELFVSSNKNYSNLSYPIVKDSFQNMGPLSGIHAILKAIPTQKVLIIPVDTPLLSKELLQFILDNYEPDKQLSICKTADGLQMLIGVFDKSLLPIIENQINNKEYKLTFLLDKASSQILDVSHFKDACININTQEAWKKLNNKFKNNAE